MKKILLPAAGLMLASVFPVQAVERGELLANSCFSCHGYEGRLNNAIIPTLENYPASLIISQMKAYRDGTRPGTIMDRHAKGYTDEEIELMAKFIGKQGL
ncbi:cytochrome C [Thiomicrospira sp. R3]|uniref:c-type cytochrome n=1 Tax=Thiomicrospira sp. R3 TaxID=3035472 RepID=UPI00259B8DDE|nr:c-type cytochrome [Thiomicrospira sp. R3]WFE69638.1 cytochrome C [Thiomicrospira sp. R3]